MLARVILWLILCALMTTSTLATEQGRLSVYTVNYPLHYFAQRIAGERAEVLFPVPSDLDPAFWQPAAEIIAGYQQADLILLNGARYAKWLDSVTLPRRKLVDTSAAFRDRYIHLDDAMTHSHGPAGDHSHGSIAFTTWLDFNQAVEQARAISEALTRKRPEWKEEFMRNLAALEADLTEFDKQIRGIVAARPNQPLMVSHPVYQYFQRRYGLDLKSVMWEADEYPSEALWSEFERGLKEHPAQWMIWEGEPNPESIERLRSMGVENIVFNPAGNQPDQGDFLSVMRQNVKNLQQAFK